jgi:hypothetical protein
VCIRSIASEDCGLVVTKRWLVTAGGDKVAVYAGQSCCCDIWWEGFRVVGEVW